LQFFDRNYQVLGLEWNFRGGFQLHKNASLRIYDLPQRDLTHGKIRPACPTIILIVFRRPRKTRSPILANASASGSRAIVFLRLTIRHRSFALKSADWLRSRLSELVAVRNRLRKPTKNTAEQSGVRPSTRNIARLTAKEKRNRLLPKLWP